MRRIVAGSLYVAASVALAALAAWPIYRSGAFVLLVSVASLLAAGIAILVTVRRAGGWTTVGLLAAVTLVVGVPLAVPSRLSDAASFAVGLRQLGTGLVVGWKDLLTVELPVGSYRNLLVPALFVFLVGTTVALLLAWRPGAAAAGAVPVAVAMTGFGLLFGRTEVSAPVAVGPLTLGAPIETAVGLGSLTAGVLWLSWRSRDARVRALRASALASGSRVRRVGRTDPRRVGFGVAMVVIAALGALVVPAVAAPIERDVLRESTGPSLEISRAISPLSAYRSFFSDAEHDVVLFTATGDAVPERVRLAVLDSYDGTVFRTSTDVDGADFVRMASARTPGDGARVDVDITVEGLAGIWMPTAGSLASVDFLGARAAALADGFYVAEELSAAVQTTGWEPGDAYRLQAAEPVTSALAEAEAPGMGAGAGGSDPEAPASLRAWVTAHVSGTGGAALEGLVALLRARGYLSHSLDETQSEWMQDAGVDSFLPSAAGHSLARVDQLFTALLEREQDPAAVASGNLVAAVGDDEQFAVAVALIARELGFPARVVVGVRTESADPALTTCQAGQCRAEDVSAWVEVRSAAGEWIAVDVTPQHTQSPSAEVTAQPDPTIGTEVRPDMVAEVEPPKPAQEAAPSASGEADETDLAWLWAALQISCGVLGVVLLLVGPSLLIIAAKALRRRSRRGSGDAVDRIAGGWEEYVDAAADAGRRPPVNATRLEAAELLGAGGAAGSAGLRGAAGSAGAGSTAGSGTAAGAVALARGADEAVFSARTITDDDAAAFWLLVDAERSRFATTRWQRLRATVSLRSFVSGDRRRSPVNAPDSKAEDSSAQRPNEQRPNEQGSNEQGRTNRS
ncbi:MAG: transglutaminase domain-containing protein [Microbacterium sp.]